MLKRVYNQAKSPFASPGPQPDLNPWQCTPQLTKGLHNDRINFAA